MSSSTLSVGAVMRTPTPRDVPTRRLMAWRWAITLSLVVVLVAAPLRLVWLDAYPPDLFYDPAGEGLAAVDILNGARPVFLPANNGREPLLNYLMAMVFAVTGPTSVGLKLTVALIGLASIPISYLWARAWFGPRVALLSAALMAASTWHLFLSRFGVRAVLLPLLEPLVLLLIWRAARSGRLLTWAVAGLALGLSAYSYLPIRLFPIVVIAVLAGAWHVNRRRLSVSGLLAMLGVAAAVIAPLALYFAAHPEQLTQRVDQVSLLEQPDALEQVARALVATLGMFVWRGDAFPFTNVPGRPVFDALIAPFFVLGLVVAIRRARRAPYALLLVWLVVMLLPGALAIAAPNSQRTAGLMPAIFVIPALGLTTAAAWLLRRERPNPGAARAIVALGAAGIVGGSAVLTTHAYFVEFPRVPELVEWYETDVAALGRRVRTLPAETQVFAALRELPDTALEDHNHWTLSFLGGRRVRAFESGLVAIPDTTRRPATYLFPSLDQAVARRSMPAGSDEPLVDPFSGRQMLAFHIPRGTPFEPQHSLDVGWSNGARLLGTMSKERAPSQHGADLPSEIVLYWAGTAVSSTPADGRFVVSLHDGDGRSRDVVRFPAHRLFCPAEACGEVVAIARSIYLSSAGNAERPLSIRIRLLADDGDTIGAENRDGRKVGPSVRLWRSEPS